MCVIFEPIMSATAIVLPLRVCYAPPLSAVTFRVPCLIGSDGGGGGRGDRRTVYTRIRIYAERADTVDNQTACVRILAEHKHTAHTHALTLMRCVHNQTSKMYLVVLPECVFGYTQPSMMFTC